MPCSDSTARTIKACGDDLLSIRLGVAKDAQAFAEQLRAAGEWQEVVAGIESVVVQFDVTLITIDEARQQIAAELAKGYTPKALADVLLEIPVVYGGEFGPDFDAVCEQTGLSAEELIALHTGGNTMSNSSALRQDSFTWVGWPMRCAYRGASNRDNAWQPGRSGLPMAGPGCMHWPVRAAGP